MARFYEIEEGTRAVKIIDMPLANVPHGVQKDSPEQQKERELRPQAYPTLRVGVRALLAFERERILELAALRCKSKGGTPEENNPLYNHALAIYTVASSCVDPDAAPGTDAPLFFAPKGQEFSIEAAAEVLRTSKHITDDTILYLRERQEAWQDQINPQAMSLADNELWDVVKKGVEDEGFFHSFRAGLLVRLTNTMASLVVDLLGDKLQSGASESPPTTLQ